MGYWLFALFFFFALLTLAIGTFTVFVVVIIFLVVVSCATVVVSGATVVVSDAVPAGEAYLGDKTATKCFLKKGIEVEQERDANTRKNKIFARKVMLVALVDSGRMVKLTASAQG